MAYVERRRNVRVTEEKDTVIGRFGAQFVSCALILCICAGCKYSGLFPNKVVQLRQLITYNTDVSVIKDKISSFVPTKPFAAPLKGTITDPYGGKHKGIDIAVAADTPIDAVANGTVIMAGENGNYGNCVQLQHDNGYITLYGHCNSISVKVGDKVKMGAEIAKAGSTGDSTGVHLHYEVIKNNKNIDPKRVTKGL